MVGNENVEEGRGRFAGGIINLHMLSERGVEKRPTKPWREKRGVRHLNGGCEAVGRGGELQGR